MTPKDCLNYLIRLYLGTETVAVPLDGVCWPDVFELSRKEGVSALLAHTLDEIFEPLNRCFDGENPAYKHAKVGWIGCALQTMERNNVLNKRVCDLAAVFARAGYRTCVLKGQGAAQSYPCPELRDTGDIDLWVEGKRDDIIRFLKKKGEIGKPTIHHVSAEVFADVDVEIHYMPAWLYNPLANRKLQRFFRDEANSQFSHKCPLGLAYPTVRFNLIYMAVHIYKHTFNDSIALKQLIDYFYVLKHATEEERQWAKMFLADLGLDSFIQYLMWRLSTELGLPQEYLLSTPDSRCRHPLGEAVCFYPWKVWHWCWRRWHGYL